MRDSVNEAALSALIATRALPNDLIEVHDELPSTNTRLRAMVPNGAPHGTVVWAHAQSAGKGSRARSFCSPQGGLYFSVLLRNCNAPMQITCAAAVAVHQAIQQVFGITTDIKWVNDLYLNGRKVCGILCESVTMGSTLTAAVLGIGINLVVPDGGFPPAIAEIAGALCSTPPPADRTQELIVEILARLYPYLDDVDASYMQVYRDRNLVLGRQVLHHVGDGTIAARVQSITDQGTLLLRDTSGRIYEACSGEITLTQ